MGQVKAGISFVVIAETWGVGGETARTLLPLVPITAASYTYYTLFRLYLLSKLLTFSCR
jgi:hypothetical protein